MMISFLIIELFYPFRFQAIHDELTLHLLYCSTSFAVFAEQWFSQSHS